MPTTKAAVLGHPIAHSLSPVLHNAAYQALGLGGWEYVARDVASDALGDFLNAEKDNWVGFSLTMPLKITVLDWLQHQPGRYVIDPVAETVGAANTLVIGDPIAAHNTDVYGIVAAIREVIRHGPVESIAIIGAGATAASALAAAQELGAQQIVVYARETSRWDLVAVVAEKLGITNIVQYKYITDAAAELGEFDAVISTLPAHAADPLAAQLIEAASPTSKLRKSPAVEPVETRGLFGALLDVVYDPSPTDLMATWSALGGAVVGGERMLLHQAVKQVELMTGQPAPLAAMETALNAALGTT